MRVQIRSALLAVGLAALSLIVALPAVQATQQCNAAPSHPNRGWWSYRIIDGRKCWYEGKPGLSKSLLEWRARPSQRQRPKEELAKAAPVESPGNPLDAQAWAPPASDTFEELWRARVVSPGR
jgi:hypothetical protein